MSQTFIIRRALAVGDALAGTVVADKLINRGFEVRYQTHPFIHPLIKRHPKIAKVEKPNGHCHVNLDGAYENSEERNRVHMYEFFVQAANNQLRGQGVNLGTTANCRPRIHVEPWRKQAVRKEFEEHPRPWVYICPKSHTYNVRDIPAPTWGEAAKQINGTCFWIGLDDAPKGIVDLKCRTLDAATIYLSAADLLVTVDTGPMHIAAAMDIPIVAICQASSPELHLSDQCDFLTIKSKLDCLNCQKWKCPINEKNPPCQKFDPYAIATWVNRQLQAQTNELISCVIPIYRPEAAMLNRCIEAVLPQVNEIVITRDIGGNMPLGVIRNPKIRHVVKNARNIGFGRNVNFGVRQSYGKYVLVLNDDVYLAPDAVSRMMDCMKPEVGIVGQLLRFPDGKIYHAGKRRSKTGIGFPHVDLNKESPSITGPIEMENTNGASILFRRKAFYDGRGYDEDFWAYCDDDAVCMRVRRAGWRLFYTPHATGIHECGRELRKVNGIYSIMSESNRKFAWKWGPYFEHNKNNPGIGNFDYLNK